MYVIRTLGDDLMFQRKQQDMSGGKGSAEKLTVVTCGFSQDGVNLQHNGNWVMI